MSNEVDSTRAGRRRRKPVTTSKQKCELFPTKPPSDLYRENYENIFRKSGGIKETKETPQLCNVCSEKVTLVTGIADHYDSNKSG